MAFCSLTAIKGLKMWIYWFIVRVLSSSRPYQALIFVEKLTSKYSCGDKTFTFTSFISSPPTRLKNDTWDRPANPQHTSVRKFDEIKWKLSLSLCFCENKRIVDNLQPPTSPRLLQPGFHLPRPPAGLQDGVGQGRPPTWAASCRPASVPITTITSTSLADPSTSLLRY